MSRFPSLEARSLKWKLHYPPDVYAQREEQKEDLMSEDFVRDGYKYIKPVRDEYDSCKKESKYINTDSLRKLHHRVISHKTELTPLLDFKKRPSASLRDSFIPVIDINKSQISDWFKELAGSTSLQNLGRRVPYSKDKEEILNEIVSNKVPLSRALWLVNISIIHASAHVETTKRKPRAPFDPTNDWITAIFRILERSLEQLLVDPSCTSLHDDWNYLFSLLVALYDADIADHWDVLVWLIKRAESAWKISSGDDDTKAITMDYCLETLPALRTFIKCLLDFGYRFAENELITRRLLFWICRIFVFLAFNNAQASYELSESGLKALLHKYTELSSSPIQFDVVKSISSLIISLTLRNPSAVIWNHIPFETEHAYLEGSPLDVIPISLSTLPIPDVPGTSEIRKFVLDLEDTIIARGKLIESGWKFQSMATPRGEHIHNLARLLDVMDKQPYYTVHNNNPVEFIFNCVFGDDTVNVDTQAVVSTLCEWAVSVHRVGIHRPIIVACMLEKLYSTFRSNPVPCRLLRATLMDFLDQFSARLPPFTGDQAPIEHQPMRNLVCLFAELIDREVFSHDEYVRRMIARGVFGTNCHPLAVDTTATATANSIAHPCATNQRPNAPHTTLTTLPLTSSTAQCSVTSEFSEENDRCSIDNPDSVRSDLGLPGNISVASCQQANLTMDRSQHFHYLAQFPLPQDETYLHEQNQRAQLLYGSTRSKDRARNRVRQLSRDICKLFTRKVYLIDVVHGEMCRRKKTKDRDKDKDSTHGSGFVTASGQKEDTHSLDKLQEDITSRFLNLSYHDMEWVISQCTPTFIKVLSGNSSLSSATGEEHSGPMSNANPAPTTNLSHIYMPVPSSIFLFFELIEHSLNITCLISTIVDALERLQLLFKARTNFMSLYMSFLFLRAIGVLQRHQPILFMMGDLPTRLFPILITQVLQIKDPAQCRPFERCILAYIHDLFKSNRIIRFRFSQSYGKAHPRVSTLFVSVEPAEGVGEYDPEYANDLLTASMLDNLRSLRACYEHLRGSANARFSFVCRAVIFVCQASTIERVNYLCDLCAELTSQCPELTPEWLGSLYAVLAPRPYVHSYTPIVNAIGPSDLYMYDNFSSLIGTLLSRHCFTIGDFLRRVICPAMAQGLDQPVGPHLEPSIRLACHVLHRLFTAESTVSSLQNASTVLTPNREPTVLPPSLCGTDAVTSTPCFQISEPLLLTGALQKVTPLLLVDVLKMLMVHNDKAVLGDSNQVSDSTENIDESEGIQGHREDEDPRSTDTDTEEDAGCPTSDSSRHKKRQHSGQRKSSSKRDRSYDDVRRNLHPIVHRFLESGALPTVSELRSLPLYGLVQLVLREICTVPWVRDMFYRMAPKELICKNVLIDDKFSPSQARRLLHIIFYPSDTSWTDVTHLPVAMCEILSGLQLWTLKCSQMKFQLLYSQIPFAQRSDVLSNVGQAIVQGFQTQALQWLTSNGLSADGSFGPTGGLSNFELNDTDPVWLLSTFVQELPKSVKEQIVKATSETLKGIKNFWKHKNDEDKESVLLNYSVILAHPAFTFLLEKCLDDMYPAESLYEQIDYFVENARATRDRVPDNLRTRQIVQECLRLRLSLMGRRFEALQKDPEASAAGALLLTQLISHGVTEPESNSSLFYMVYDMLQTFVHTLAAKSDIDGKHYQNFVKKARRELAERPSTYGIEHIKPLLPPVKGTSVVIVTDKTGSQTNPSGPSGTSHTVGTGSGSSKLGGSGKVGSSKANGNLESDIRGTGASDAKKSRERKKGLSILSKERIAYWDLYDSAKQALLLSMHGASRVGAIPSRTEEQANRLIRHDHFILMRRSPDFYFAPVYALKTPEDQSVEKNENYSGSRVEAYQSPHVLHSAAQSAIELPVSSAAQKSFSANRNDAEICINALQKNSTSNLMRDHLCDPRDAQLSNTDYHTNLVAPFAYQRARSVYPTQVIASNQLQNAAASTPVKGLMNPQFSQQPHHHEDYPMDPQIRFAQSKRKFGEIQSNSIDISSTASEAKVMRLGTKISSESTPSSSNKTPKRKRSTSRRGSTSTIAERAGAGDHRPGPMDVVPPGDTRMDLHHPANSQRAPVEYGVALEGDQWIGVESKPFRSSVPMANFRGFIHNRAQQQRASLQQSQMYSDPVASQAGRTPAYFPVSAQHSADMANSSYLTNTVEYNLMEMRSAGNYATADECALQSARQYATGPIPTQQQQQRYIIQQRHGMPTCISGPQIPVPNPPPYPQQALMSNTHPSNQPTAYVSRNMEDNYAFVVENDTGDPVSRITRQQLYRNPAYSNTSVEQIPMESMGSVHSGSQPTMYQRAQPGNQLLRPDISSQNAPTQPQPYSRYAPY